MVIVALRLALAVEIGMGHKGVCVRDPQRLIGDQQTDRKRVVVPTTRFVCRAVGHLFGGTVLWSPPRRSP
jgi:hypothetical protein